MYWVLSCLQISMSYLEHFDDLRSNTSLYFLRTTHFVFAGLWNGKFAVGSKPLAKQGCYYLGRYSNFWNVDNKRIVFAHNLMTLRNYPLEPTARFYGEHIPTESQGAIDNISNDFGEKNITDYLYPERMIPSQREAFFDPVRGAGTKINQYLDEFAFGIKKDDIKTYLHQKTEIDKRKIAFKSCMDRMYPKPTKPAPVVVKTPEGPRIFTPDPKEPVSLPTPSSPPLPQPMKGETKLTLSFDLGLTPASRTNIFNLKILMLQKKA